MLVWWWMALLSACLFFFFFNDTATTEIYTLSLHDALPIFRANQTAAAALPARLLSWHRQRVRSEEHTSELQSRLHLVCRLLLEKKKKKQTRRTTQQERKSQTILSSCITKNAIAVSVFTLHN